MIRGLIKASGCFSFVSRAIRRLGCEQSQAPSRMRNGETIQGETSDESRTVLFEVPEDYEASLDSEMLKIQMIGYSKPRRFLVLRKERR